MRAPGCVSVDTGGTFTDLVYTAPDGDRVELKVPSNPKDPERAVQAALHALKRDHPTAQIDELRHGSTVATNALLERGGARTLFITTSGFEDLLELRRQSRPELYALHPVINPPLATSSIGINERVGARGEVLSPLADTQRWIQLNRTALESAQSIAICLLHAYRNPAHERLLAARLREQFPDTPVCVSSELIPLHREFERASTVTVNAYVAPIMSRYLHSLSRALDPVPVSVMGSAGGLLSLEHAAREPVHTVLSGPAGGVRGAVAAGFRAGRERLLTLDMGGTSTDVSVLDGTLVPDDDSQIDGHPIRVPILPIETVGAGGGSIASIDAGGALRVGPQSAGASPGPACYGHGGREPTVTDAHVVLGRIDRLLGGELTLDVDASRQVVSRLANTVGATTEETALAIIAIAEANMARACKRVTMDRGVDPRTLTLVAFGGAGGLHACALADALGCSDVLFPRAPGLLSAEGIGHAPHESSASHSTLILLKDLDAAVLEAVAKEARRDLNRDDVTVRIVADTRFRGQSHCLPVGLAEQELDETVGSRLEERFLELHEERYGYVLNDHFPIELVAVRAFAQIKADDRPAPAKPTDELVTGPCSLSTYGATLWVASGWRARKLTSGDWRVERTEEARAPVRSGAEPLALEIHRQRLAAIAEEMGSALMRAALSANIKERRDFSCAVFDRDGEMLAQAAHIPVHLGSQPLSVKSAIAHVPMEPGQSVVVNAPYSGGTHLPDVTLVSPIFLANEDTPAFYVANRAHHADVGGISPGSMPSPRRPDGTIRALSIEDEGFVIEPQVLTDSLRRAFADASRTPDERFGDLRAQEAANRVGVGRILELVETVPDVETLNSALLDYGERRMRAILAELPDGDYFFEDTLENDGFDTKPISIRVELSIRNDQARFDFSQSDNQTPGALNAVRAITESAVFYAMRCLGDSTLPSNAGLMRPTTIVTRSGTVVDACAPAAVSSGNVETSQRLVDVVFGALAQAAPEKIPAASGGTMNNILFGGEDEEGRAFVHYETLASGAGGGPSGKGADAIQCHMTNTLNTPIEELELSFPIRIETYSIRHAENDSPRRGGCGVVRAYHFLVAMEVNLVSERRSQGPYGLGEAPRGTAGRNTLLLANGKTRTLAGKDSVLVEPGDTIVVETPGGGSWSPPKRDQ